MQAMPAAWTLVTLLAHTASPSAVALSLGPPTSRRWLLNPLVMLSTSQLLRLVVRWCGSACSLQKLAWLNCILPQSSQTTRPLLLCPKTLVSTLVQSTSTPNTLHHYIHECSENGDIHVSYVPTKDNVTDIFTKPLPTATFQCLCEFLGLCEMN